MGCCQSTATLGGHDPDDVSSSSVVERASLLGGVTRQTGARSNTQNSPASSRGQRSTLLPPEAPGTLANSASSSRSCPSFGHFMLQYRDLKPEDFDLLSKLDEDLPGRGTVPQHLADALPRLKACKCTNAPEACRVCLVKFEPSTCVVQLPCQHTFHPQCISRWLTQCKGTCPLCSAAVTCETGEKATSASSDAEGTEATTLMNPAWRKVGSSGGGADGTTSRQCEADQSEIVIN